jgi:hypothetical protein
MISSAYTAEDWPIAAAMLPFGNKDSRGGPIHDAEPAEWAKQLRLVRRIGFTEVDPTDTWVRVGDLSPQRLADFNSVLSEVGLTIPAISTSRRSVMDPDHGEEYRWSGRDWPSKRGRWRRAAGTLLLSISTRTAWPA